MKKTIVSIFLGIGVVAAIAFQLNRNQAKAAAEIQSEINSKEAAKVRTARVMRKEISQAFTANGTVESSQTLELLSETDGRVIAAYFVPGDAVVQGQKLVETDAMLKKAAHQINELNYRKAKRDVERLEALYRENNAAAIDVENARLQMETAAEQLKISQKQLSQSVIFSPIAGVVLEKKTGKGNTLQPGTPVAVIADVNTLLVRVNLPDREVIRVVKGDKVGIQTAVYPDKIYTGIIRAIIPQATQSKTFPVEILVQNSTQQPLLTGMSVEVVFGKTQKQSILALPRTALTGDLNAPAVYVVQNQTAQKRTITIGDAYGTDVAVKSGLREGETVITGGHQNVEDGAKVQ